jgi:hypothetical protein
MMMRMNEWFDHSYFTVVLQTSVYLGYCLRHFTFIPVLLNISTINLWFFILYLPFVLLRQKNGEYFYF